MIIRSFLKNKKNLKYFLILTIFSSFCLILLKYNYKLIELESNVTFRYLQINNENIEVYHKIKDIPNIKKIIIGIKTDTCQLVEESSLNDNEIIISQDVIDNKLVGDNLDIKHHDKTYNFQITHIRKDKYLYNCYISSNIFKEIYDNTETFNYAIELKNWQKETKTKTKIRIATDNKVAIDNMGGSVIIDDLNSLKEYERYNTFFNELLLLVLKVIIPTLTIIAILVIFFISDAIISNDQMYDKLYLSLGYSKNYLILTKITKIFLIIILSLLISAMFSTIIFNLLF